VRRPNFPKTKTTMNVSRRRRRRQDYKVRVLLGRVGSSGKTGTETGSARGWRFGTGRIERVIACIDGLIYFSILFHSLTISHFKTVQVIDQQLAHMPNGTRRAPMLPDRRLLGAVSSTAGLDPAHMHYVTAYYGDTGRETRCTRRETGTNYAIPQ